MFLKKTATIAGILLIAASDIACLHEEKGTADNAALSSHAQPKWIIPDTAKLPDNEEGKLIRYGRALVVNTSYYFGPKGAIANLSNGMNCQNCHLDAGAKLYGNNFSLTATGYPRYKERSGKTETIIKKVEDCFERSLNGKAIDSNSREMKAFVAYLKWIGREVKKGTKPIGSGIAELKFLNRQADTARGHAVFTMICQRCHGKDGQGVFNAAGTAYVYPPLWGLHSYNMGASMYRLSKLAGFVIDNMPFGTDHKHRQLTNEQAWDVAAFVDSQYHPSKDLNGDWPKLASKPYDYPFGPYADTLFSVRQHKYGPFGPIKKYYASLKKQ
ncbi:MAG: c-type cytochrome [Bacteroidetes bacterium]|nr:c-type cytochrome [Bacteroidota bacterium]